MMNDHDMEYSMIHAQKEYLMVRKVAGIPNSLIAEPNPQARRESAGKATH